VKEIAIKSGLGRTGGPTSVEAIVSFRGDVDMLARSVRSDWIQKARIVSTVKDSGLGDSGAQISVTNCATAEKFGLQRHKYEKPISIGFAQGAEAITTEYVVMGDVLGKVPVLEAETIFSLWSICENGYEIILDATEIQIRDKSSGETIYRGESSPVNKEWRLDTAKMLCMEVSESVRNDEMIETPCKD